MSSWLTSLSFDDTKKNVLHDSVGALEEMNILVVPKTKPTTSPTSTALALPNAHLQDEDFDSGSDFLPGIFDENSTFWDESDMDESTDASQDNNLVKYDGPPPLDVLSLGGSSTTTNFSDPTLSITSDYNSRLQLHSRSREYLQRQQRLIQLKRDILGPKPEPRTPERSKEEQDQLCDLACLLATALELENKPKETKKKPDATTKLKTRSLHTRRTRASLQTRSLRSRRSRKREPKSTPVVKSVLCAVMPLKSKSRRSTEMMRTAPDSSNEEDTPRTRAIVPYSPPKSTLGEKTARKSKSRRRMRQKGRAPRRTTTPTTLETESLSPTTPNRRLECSKEEAIQPLRLCYI